MYIYIINMHRAGWSVVTDAASRVAARTFWLFLQEGTGLEQELITAKLLWIYARTVSEKRGCVERHIGFFFSFHQPHHAGPDVPPTLWLMGGFTRDTALRVSEGNDRRWSLAAWCLEEGFHQIAHVLSSSVCVVSE